MYSQISHDPRRYRDNSLKEFHLGVGQSGRSLALEARSRRFKSCHLDQISLKRDRSTVGHRPPNPSIQVQILVALPISLSDYEHDFGDEVEFCPKCHEELDYESFDDIWVCPKCGQAYELAGVAQMIEQGFCKPQVAGLIPVAGSISIRPSSKGKRLDFQSGNREFNSPWSYQTMNKISSVGEIGRRTGFRFQRGNPCQFDSDTEHHPTSRVEIGKRIGLKNRRLVLTGSNPVVRTNVNF